ncbi:MAG: tetratricopeptide repeat protein [Candidatus Binatia bacterium]|nr:tetratricopeptide repeat protein [Candidatus Binatia bacterium]
MARPLRCSFVLLVFFTLPWLGCTSIEPGSDHSVHSRRRAALEERNRLSLEPDEPGERQAEAEFVEEALSNPQPSGAEAKPAATPPAAEESQLGIGDGAASLAHAAQPPANSGGSVAVSKTNEDSVAPLIGPGTPAHVAAALRCVERGRSLLAHGRTDAAREWLERALTLDGNNVYAFYFLARAAVQAGRLEQAEAFSARALTLASQANGAWQSRVLALRGEVLEAVGRFPEARQAYRRAAELDPTNVQAQTGLARLAQPE